MKTLTIAILFATIVLSTQNIQKVVQAIKKFNEVGDQFEANCMKESNASEELVRRVHNGEMVNDKNVKCHLKCMLTKTGIIDAQGSLQRRYVKSALQITDKSLLKKILTQCDKTDPDLCEAAFMKTACTFQVIMAH